MRLTKKMFLLVSLLFLF